MSKQLEADIQKQSEILSKKIPSLLDSLKGKFVAYFDGDMIVADTHEDCFKKAEKKYGNNPFVIDEVTPLQPMVSSLIKLG
jgi:hypothetical protein